MAKIGQNFVFFRSKCRSKFSLHFVVILSLVSLIGLFFFFFLFRFSSLFLYVSRFPKNYLDPYLIVKENYFLFFAFFLDIHIWKCLISLITCSFILKCMTEDDFFFPYHQMKYNEENNNWKCKVDLYSFGILWSLWRLEHRQWRLMKSSWHLISFSMGAHNTKKLYLFGDLIMRGLFRSKLFYRAEKCNCFSVLFC